MIFFNPIKNGVVSVDEGFSKKENAGEMVKEWRYEDQCKKSEAEGMEERRFSRIFLSPRIGSKKKSSRYHGELRKILGFSHDIR